MAFAIASGAKPEQGLYTAIIAGLIVSTAAAAACRSPADGAFIVILSGITATHGIEGLQIATLMAGVMVVLLACAPGRHHSLHPGTRDPRIHCRHR